MRNGLLAILLTASVANGWAMGQQYLPGYPAHPAYGRAGTAPMHMVPHHGFRNVGYPQGQRMHPGIRRASYAPGGQAHPLSNGQSPPIAILPDTDVPGPLPVETQEPEILTFPPKRLPNSEVQAPAAGNPSVEQLPNMPKKAGSPDAPAVDPRLEVESTVPTDDSTTPGSPILYDELNLAGGPECYPECIGPPPEPVVIPPIKPLGYKFYGGAEYLYWWVRGQSSPVLLNYGPVPSDFPISIGGGELPFDNRQRSGVRMNLGMWLDRDQLWAVEGSGMYLFDRSPSFNVSSPPALPLSRPFTNSNGDIKSAVLISATGILEGTALLESFHRLWATEVSLRRNLIRRESWWFDMFGGFRWIDLEEGLGIESNSITLATDAALALSDRFDTSNEVAAAQIGFQGEYQFWRMFINSYGKVAFGNNRQAVTINGSRSFTPVGSVPVITTGGLLAQESNIGRHTRNQFTFAPEVGASVGFVLSDSFRMAVGYTFLFMTDVVRPGNQINTTVNPTQGGPGAVGAPAPIFEFASEDYWAHGINFLLEFRY